MNLPPHRSITRGAFALLASATIALHVARLSAEETHELQPPFGLSWNESALDLEEALLATDAKIGERKKEAGGGETWIVTGLPQIALQRVIFHLRAAHLSGVELEYGKADWTEANYDNFIRTVRQRLDEKHGTGKLIARKKDSDRGVLQTLLGYAWEVPGGSIELVYFAAQNPANIFRTVSLHYSAPVAPPAPETAKR